MHPVLSGYIPTAKLIAQTFGSTCEVVLHDLTTPEQSVVFTLNNQVTGRKVGQSFTHLVKEVLLADNFADDCVSNYPTRGGHGKTIKSSTALIRDEAGGVVGALCVNVDITHSAAMLLRLEEFCAVKSPQPVQAEDKGEESYEVVGGIQEIVQDIIEHAITAREAEDMTREEKIGVVRFLNDKGVFLIKGSVDKVAQRMGISRVTVYSYLDAISKGG